MTRSRLYSSALMALSAMTALSEGLGQASLTSSCDLPRSKKHTGARKLQRAAKKRRNKKKRGRR